MKVRIGIDNGLKGCAAAIRDGKMVGVAHFKEAKPRRVFNVMDGAPLTNLLKVLKEDLRLDPCDIEVLLEEPAINQGARTNATAIASTAASFGRTLLVLETAGIPSVNIITCAAVSWQKFWWKTNSSSKDDAKPSIEIAQKLFGINFIPKGCSTPSDGWSDAALMGYMLDNDKMRKEFMDDSEKRAADKVKTKARKKAKQKKATDEVRALLGGLDFP